MFTLLGDGVGGMRFSISFSSLCSGSLYFRSSLWGISLGCISMGVLLQQRCSFSGLLCTVMLGFALSCLALWS